VKLDLPVSFREECERCAQDLHVCWTCFFYDRTAANGCRESSADPVQVKDRRNLCDYWRAGDGLASATSVDDAKKKLLALFDKKR
jgi:hypothetical protein